MSLNLETFSNVTGGFSAFKAIGHPMIREKSKILMDNLQRSSAVAVYDPHGLAVAFAALYDCETITFAGTYVQDIDAIGTKVLGNKAQPITDLPLSNATTVFITAFDADRLVDNIRHLIPDGAKLFSLDDMRLDNYMLTNKQRYLDPLNFATNFAFFRDSDGYHTRLVSANYWSGYGAKDTQIWCQLFGAEGNVLAEWTLALGVDTESIVIDSKEVRSKFDLDDFCGQLFLHVVNGAGHDVVKYALDTYGDNETVLSCTHDANAWPADLYAGLPAPGPNETVVLWIQNSHPCAIPKGAIGLNRMGDDQISWLKNEVPAFGSYPLDVSTLLPHLSWPDHIEIQAGKHFVRPRYEVTTKEGRLRINHPNVERTDLTPDPKIPDLNNLMGKGYLLPAPILPLDRFKTSLLPTPMATCQNNLPVTAIAYNQDGCEIARHAFGCLPRDHSAVLETDKLINGTKTFNKDYGHLELIYDFTDGGEADGWLHGLFRYEDRNTGHTAETSFGAHIFNCVLTYKNEPQSYAGPAPGLSTRLFLRLGRAPQDTMCHLIYPASTPWHGVSQTHLTLFNCDGKMVSEHDLSIPCGGSILWRYSEMFDEKSRKIAGDDAYVIIRDTSTRLFGYHGLLNGTASFSIDHMFGF
ncbi:MAG: hypothetical protein CMM28_02630 [Rhodospirillaceae bacterium]|nr:hypothetical protein [Rhodospirillaceae bacterium]